MLILWAEEKCLAAATIAASGPERRVLVSFPADEQQKDSKLEKKVYQAEFSPLLDIVYLRINSTQSQEKLKGQQPATRNQSRENSQL